MTTTSRAFVMADIATFEHFHRERRAIDRRYPACTRDIEDWDTFAMMRRVAMNELRAEVARWVQHGCGGDYLIPI